MHCTDRSLEAASLEAMMGIPCDDFARRYWGRRYRHFHQGVEQVHAAMGGAWSMPDWRRAIETAYRWPGSPQNLGADGHKAEPDAVRPNATMRLTLEQMGPVLDFGITVIGDALNPRLSQLAARWKRELRVGGEVSTYASLSPRGAGAPVHYDPFHVFVVQLWGRKVWRLSPAPVVDNPITGRSVANDGTINGRRLEEETVERVDADNLIPVTLEPGDVLYVPAGMLHATEALDQSLSVMVNFQAPRFETLLELVLRRILRSDPAWRNMPPGADDESQAAYLNEGFARARAALENLNASSPEVVHVLNSMAANMGDLQNSYAASFGQDAAIEPDTQLVLTNRYPVTHASRINESGDEVFTVFLGPEEISDSGAGGAFLKSVVEHEQFRAEEARHWSGESYDWEIVQSYLSRLAEQGLLVAQ